MSEHDEQHEDFIEPSEDELDAAAEAIEFPDLEAEETQPETEPDPVLAMRAERDALEDKLRRTIADYQNFARRAEQNVGAARQQQLIDMARKLVTVLDHLDHALAGDPTATSSQDLLKGVGIVRDEFMRTLASFGIQHLDVQPGEPFDPNRHEALMRQPGGDIESNHVTMQLQPGYIIDDKTIRAAKVSIAE